MILSFNRIKSFLPQPARTRLSRIRSALRVTSPYLRGKHILRQYTNHYHKAQTAFGGKANKAETVIATLDEVGVRATFFGEESQFIKLPNNYLELISRVSECAKPRFSLSKECSFLPRLPTASLPARTEDIPAIQAAQVITVRLKDPFNIDGIEDLCSPIMKELERKVYGSYAIVDKIYCYRSLISRQTRSVSWLWHYDNHPREILKIMIYLSDVDTQNAPFEYLRHAKSLKPVYGSPLAPLCGDSRINEERMQRYLTRGFESHQVTGPSGTLILFDNNVIHRGNLACKTHRDVLVLQVRPTTVKTDRYIDPRWTGSFQHGDFNPNPADHKPGPKT